MPCLAIPAVILAGGRSSRMGGADKSLLRLNGRSLIEHVIAALAPQVSRMLINTNNDPENFSHLGLPVLADTLPGFQGPLAGILTGMTWARQIAPKTSHIMVVPGDVPFLPEDLVARLYQVQQACGAEAVIARHAGRPQPVIGLWPLKRAGLLARDLLKTDMRKARQWLDQFPVTEVEFPSAKDGEFFNINRPDDLLQAHIYAARRSLVGRKPVAAL